MDLRRKCEFSFIPSLIISWFKKIMCAGLTTEDKFLRYFSVFWHLREFLFVTYHIWIQTDRQKLWFSSRFRYFSDISKHDKQKKGCFFLQPPPLADEPFAAGSAQNGHPWSARLRRTTVERLDYAGAPRAGDLRHPLKEKMPDMIK